MSLAIWSIALLHGFFVLIISEMTHSKAAIACAAVVAAAAGVLTGNPIYIALDLLCVAVATYFCWTALDTQHHRTPQEIAAAEERARLERIKVEEATVGRNKAIADFFQAVVVLGGIAVFFFWKFWEPSVPQTTTPNTGLPPQSYQAIASPPRTAPLETKNVSNTKPSKVEKRKEKKAWTPPKHPVEKCLEIPNEQTMIRCLERVQ